MMGPAATRQGDPAQRGLLHFVGVGLSAGLLALMVALAAAVIVIPALFGGVPLTVLTGSMEPFFRLGRSLWSSRLRCGTLTSATY